MKGIQAEYLGMEPEVSEGACRQLESCLRVSEGDYVDKGFRASQESRNNKVHNEAAKLTATATLVVNPLLDVPESLQVKVPHVLGLYP